MLSGFELQILNSSDCKILTISHLKHFEQLQPRCVFQVIMPLLTSLIGSRAKQALVYKMPLWYLAWTPQERARRNPSVAHRYSPVHHLKTPLSTHRKVGYKGAQIAMLPDWWDWFLWQFLRLVILQAIQEAFLRQLLRHAEVHRKVLLKYCSSNSLLI